MCWKTPYYQLQNIGAGKVFPSPGLFGGYPPSTGYRKNLFGTNVLEVAGRKEPYPLADGIPGESKIDEALRWERAHYDKLTVTLPEPFHQGDLYLSILMGGAGCGDVLERSPQRIEEDLNGGFLTPEFARRIYAAHAERRNGRYRVDPEKTGEMRKQAYSLRKRRSVPVREWIDKERERVRRGAFIAPARNMYRQSMKLSPSFAEQMGSFRGLEEGWQMPDPGEGAPGEGADT